MALTSGAKIGPYEIQSPLGAGGMGEVYRARDTRLDRSVAIKILPEAFLSDADRLQRFQHEARILSSLNHPNLLAIFDVGSQNGSHYLVSELLEGKTLRERLSEGPLSLRKAVEYGVQMGNGLAASHEKGIVHRDLKPDNVFITKDGRVKILDFGLAKPSPKADVNTAAVTVATLPGVVLGTAGYMSPEQVRGQSTDLRSDIFSFGAILYEMVSGKRAFARDSSIETMNAILKEDPPDVSTETKNISPAMQRLIHRCLEKAPEERFQSARDLAFALDALSGTSSTSETRLHAAPSPRKVRTTALASFAALLMLAGGFLVGMRAGKPSYPAFHQLIFGRGYIETARFTPDGQDVIYGAAWNNQPFEIFSTRLEGLESRSLGLPPANILGIASNGQMALGLGWHHTLNWMTIGTLAEASLSGGSPRLLLEKVCDGDISQDGKQFAVVRCSSSEQTLESPIGKVLYRTNGYISHVRMSPQGEAIAFCDHPVLGDDRGSVAMVDLEGKLSRLTQIWSSTRGLAWQPSGQEVWFTASPHEDAQVLYAVSRNGRLRTVLSSPAYLWLQDISADGKVLLGNSQESSPVAIHRAGVMADKILDLASESAITTGISDDGSLIAIDYSGSGSGSDYAVYVAKADGSPLVRLGDGSAMGITPDGKSIIALLPSTNSTFRLLPTGAGETRTFEVSPVHALDYYGNWVRDGTKFVFLGSEPGKKTRAYLLDTTTGKASPVTPEGTIDPLISPDGKFVAARDLKQEFHLYPLAGGEPQTVKGLQEGELPIQWDTTGTKLYVWDRTFPAHVFLVDLRSGERREWTTLVPPDSAGVLYGNIDMTPDGKTSVYRYRRNVTTLFLAEGLK